MEKYFTVKPKILSPWLYFQYLVLSVIVVPLVFLSYSYDFGSSPGAYVTSQISSGGLVAIVFFTIAGYLFAVGYSFGYWKSVEYRIFDDKIVKKMNLKFANDDRDYYRRNWWNPFIGLNYYSRSKDYQIAVDLKDVKNVSFSSGYIQNMYGVGTVRLSKLPTGTGSYIMRLNNIEHPQKIANMIKSRIQTFKAAEKQEAE